MTVKRQNNNNHLTVDIGAQPPLASCENAFEVLSKIQGEFFSTLGDQVTVKGTSVMFNKVPESEQIQTDSDGKVKWQKWFLDTDISTEMRIVWKCRDASSTIQTVTWDRVGVCPPPPKIKDYSLYSYSYVTKKSGA